MEEQDIHEEMNNLSSGFPKKTSPVIPAGYFDSFPDRVLNQWKREGSKPLYKKLQRKGTITIAASVAVLVLAGWLIFSKPVETNALANITPNEAYQYIYEHIEDFEGLLENAEEWNEEIEIDIPQEDIEQYLIEETSDEEPEEIF